MGLRFAKIIEKVEKNKAQRIELLNRNTCRPTFLPATSTRNLKVSFPCSPSPTRPSYAPPQTERSTLRPNGSCSKRSTWFCLPTDLFPSQNIDCENRFSVRLRASELFHKFTISNSHELLPGDIFDHLFTSTDEPSTDISAVTPSVLLVASKDDIDDIFRVIRSAKDSRLLKQFIEAFNLPSNSFFSETLCQFVAKTRVN